MVSSQTNHWLEEEYLFQQGEPTAGNSPRAFRFIMDKLHSVPQELLYSKSVSTGDIARPIFRENGQDENFTGGHYTYNDGDHDFGTGEYDGSECSDSEDSHGSRSPRIPVVPMTFASETAASRIPPEIWDAILDCLADDPVTLLATELVCKAWRPRSALHLEKPIAELEGNLLFEESQKVYRCAKILQVDPRQRHKLECVMIASNIMHLATVAYTLAGITPRLSTILLESLSWSAGATRNCFLPLSTFTSVTNLLLEIVTVPSISEFGRIICALPSLTFLSMDGVKITNPNPPPTKRRWALPSGLDQLEFKRQNSVDVIEALRLTKLTMQCDFVRWYWLPLESLQQAKVQKLLSYCKKSMETLDIDLSVLLTLKGTIIQELIGEDEHNLNMSEYRKLEELRLEFSMNTKENHDELANVHHVIFAVLSLMPSPALQRIAIVLPNRQFAACTDDKSLWTLLWQLLRRLSRLDSLLMSGRYRRLEELDLRFPSCLDKRAPLHYSDNFLVPKLFPNLFVDGIIQTSIERPFPR
ncbi:hypothetical protein WOLCODRAFT_160925 [Wolfiporia cocos MD-104 SS10]|uniref:F-box domain-containing protein n=1 Tax=Wolfiporia cocos (strain MD-104) TaxID=742152 RepID=A0A2H3J610_WOLCO|nr:hypothetical protein WOLCODRAFT_160925 [Wolfiporia cocos MD-104 SS10]